MTLLVGFVVGAAVAALLARATTGIFTTDVFEARNFRGKVLPVGVGVLVAFTAVVAEALGGLADRTGHGPQAQGARWLVLVAVLGFAVVGLVDDLAARGSDRGFRGHLRALAAGRLTTGGLKLVLGGLLSLGLSAALHPHGVADLLVDTLLIALCANLGNLFDRAPGRVGKVGLLAFVVLAAATGLPRELVGVAVVVGAVAGLLPGDLRERFMLGDAGANALGGVLGLGLALTVGLPVRVVCLVVVLALNLLSERVSFSRVIAATPVLRELDQLGRRP